MRGRTFIALDLDEAHLVKLALDAEVEHIKRSIESPHYVHIEGVPELLARYQSIQARLGMKLKDRLGRVVARL